MKRNISLFLALVIIFSAFSFTAFADDEKRPVWITAHQCNTDAAIKDALKYGCNAMEVDIRQENKKSKEVTVNLEETKSGANPVKITDKFFLAHTIVNAASDISLHEFFQHSVLHDPQICLVIFDIKTPEYMAEFNIAVHDCLDRYFKDKKIYIIYSVATLNDAVNFGQSGFNLRSNEGVCIDYCDDANAVETAFRYYGFENCWYGDGIFLGVTGLGIKNGCKRAAYIRDNTEGACIKKVESWTVHTVPAVKERLIDWNTDSVMISDAVLKQNVKKILGTKDFDEVRFATVYDNPFAKYSGQPKETEQKYQYDWKPTGPFASNPVSVNSADYYSSAMSEGDGVVIIAIGVIAVAAVAVIALKKKKAHVSDVENKK